MTTSSTIIGLSIILTLAGCAGAPSETGVSDGTTSLAVKIDQYTVTLTAVSQMDASDPATLQTVVDYFNGCVPGLLTISAPLPDRATLLSTLQSSTNTIGMIPLYISPTAARQLYVSHEIGSSTNSYVQYGNASDRAAVFTNAIAQGIGVSLAISANPSCSAIRVAAGLL